MQTEDYYLILYVSEWPPHGAEWPLHDGEWPPHDSEWPLHGAEWPPHKNPSAWDFCQFDQLPKCIISCARVYIAKRFFMCQAKHQPKEAEKH